MKRCILLYNLQASMVAELVKKPPAMHKICQCLPQLFFIIIFMISLSLVFRSPHPHIYISDVSCKQYILLFTLIQSVCSHSKIARFYTYIFSVKLTDLNEFLSDSFPLDDYSSSLSFFLSVQTLHKHTLPYKYLLAILLLEIKICFLNLPEARLKFYFCSLHRV